MIVRKPPYRLLGEDALTVQFPTAEQHPRKAEHIVQGGSQTRAAKRGSLDGVRKSFMPR